MVVDGSIIFDTKIKTGGFEKGTDELSSKAVEIKNKIIQIEREIQKLTQELEKMADTPIDSGVTKQLEKNIAKAKNQLVLFDEKATRIGDAKQAELTSMGFNTDYLDEMLERDSEWKKVQKQLKETEAKLSSYEKQLKQVKSAESKITGKDTAEYAEKKEKLQRLSESLNVYKAKLNEVDVKETITTAKTKKTTNAFERFRKTMSKAGKALSNAFMAGAVKLIKKIGSNAKSSSKDLGGLSKILYNLKTALQGMLIYRGISKVFEFIKEGMQNIAQASPGVNKNLSMLMTSLTYLKNTLATAFAPILNVVAPILTRFIDIISSATDKIAQFMSALTGKSTYTKAVKVQQDYANSIADTTSATKKNTKATKDNQKSLAGYDELNVMQDNSTSATTSDNKSNISPEDMFTTATISKGIDNFAKQLKKRLQSQDFSGIGKLLGKKINSAIASTNWKLIGNTIAKGIKTVLNFANTFLKAFNWKLFGKSIAELINNAITSVNAGLFAKTLSNLIIGIGETLISFVSKIDWKKLSNVIISFLTSIKWSGISQVAINLIQSLTSAITNVNFSGIGNAIKSGIAKINWKGLWKNVVNLTTTALQGLTDLFGLKGINTGKLNTALKSLSSPFKSIIGSLKNMASTVMTPIINKLLPALVSLIGDVASGLSPVIDSLTPVFDILIKSVSRIIKSLSPVIKTIGTTIANIINCLTPIFEPIADMITGIVEILAPALNGILSVIGNIAKFLTPVTTLLDDTIKAFTTDLSNGPTISKQMQKEIEGLNETASELKGIIEDTNTAITDVDTNLQEVTADTSEIDDLRDRLEQLINKANLTSAEQQEMKTVADLLADKVPGFKETWECLTKTDDNGRLSFTQNKDKMVASIDKVIEKYKEQYMTEALQDQYKELYKKKIEQNAKVAAAQDEVTKAQGKYNTAVDKTYKAEEEMRNAMGKGEDVYNQAVKNYETAGTEAEKYGKALSKADENLIKAKGSQAKLDTALSNLGDTIDVVSGKYKKSNKNLQALRTTFEKGFIDEKTLKENFGLTAKQLYSQSKSVAKSVDEGYQKGLKDAAKDLETNSTGYAKDMVTAVKKELGIHSPSKVMTDIGYNTIQGFSNGISKNTTTTSAINKFMQKIKTAFANGFKSIKISFNSLPNYFANVFKSIWINIKPYLNNMLNSFQAFFNYLINGFNTVTKDMNATNKNAAKISNISYRNIPLFSNIKIPKLATGTVVPASYGEFMAILGDNKREPEVVSPLSTIKQAVKEAFEEGGFGTGNGEINLTINLDGEAVYKSVVKHDKANVKRRGTSAFAY